MHIRSRMMEETTQPGGAFPFPGKPCAPQGSGDPLKGLNVSKDGKSVVISDRLSWRPLSSQALLCRLFAPNGHADRGA